MVAIKQRRILRLFGRFTHYETPASRALCPFFGVCYFCTMVGAAKSLVELGLTQDEARAYVALVASGRTTARELSMSSGITRGRIYQVLDGLVRKGLAVDAATKVASFDPAPPAVAVENLLESRRRSLMQQEEAAKDAVRALEHLGRRDEAVSGFVEVLRHSSTIADRFREIQEQAEEEVLMFSRRPYYTFQGPAANDAEFDALSRGVRVRCVYESVLLEDVEEVAAIEKYVAAGEEARFVDTLPAKLAIVDSSVTLLTIADPRDAANFTSLLLRQPGLSQFARLAFDRIWNDATDMRSVVARHDVSPTRNSQRAS